MDREIKFRIWDKKSKHFCYTDENMDYFAYFPRIDDMVYWDGNPMDDRVVLSQYTGINDKKGRPIYEGDILNDADDLFIDAMVRFDAGGFGVDAIYDCIFCYLGDLDQDVLEVVGNVFENPELIKKK
jgi:uncharacterized phage protein (TIGR01671 family)